MPKRNGRSTAEQCGTCGRYYLQAVMEHHAGPCAQAQFVLVEQACTADGIPVTRRDLATLAHRTRKREEKRSHRDALPLDGEEDSKEGVTSHLVSKSFDVDAVDSMAIKSTELTPAQPKLWQLAGGAHWVHADSLSNLQALQRSTLSGKAPSGMPPPSAAKKGEER